MMNDPLWRRFFLEPQQTLHRRYEALRAVFVDHQPQTEVAERFGYTYNTMRRLVSDFRAQCRANQVPPFS
jgi:DNA-directed RNA polymerase specialized sigma24 family protein